jgi:hypothetical protein
MAIFRLRPYVARLTREFFVNVFDETVKTSELSTRVIASRILSNSLRAMRNLNEKR